MMLPIIVCVRPAQDRCVHVVAHRRHEREQERGEDPRDREREDDPQERLPLARVEVARRLDERGGRSAPARRTAAGP